MLGLLTRLGERLGRRPGFGARVGQNRSLQVGMMVHARLPALLAIEPGASANRPAMGTRSVGGEVGWIHRDQAETRIPRLLSAGVGRSLRVPGPSNRVPGRTDADFHRDRDVFIRLARPLHGEAFGVVDVAWDAPHARSALDPSRPPMAHANPTLTRRVGFLGRDACARRETQGEIFKPRMKAHEPARREVWVVTQPVTLSPLSRCRIAPPAHQIYVCGSQRLRLSLPVEATWGVLARSGLSRGYFS